MSSNLPSLNDLRVRHSRLCNALGGVLTQEGELAARTSPLYGCMFRSLRLIHELDGHDGGIFKTSCGNIVRLFQSLLGHFHHIALNEVARRELEEARRSKKPKSNSKATKSTAPEAERQCKIRLEALVKIISTMFLTIDTTKEADSLICGGLIAALFDHVGSSLSLMVFIDPGSNDAGLKPVRGVLDVAHIEAESAIATAELSGPYLISMLRTALGVARKSTIATRNYTSHQSKDTPDAGPGQESLLHRVEERLQHTLLRGVFGDDDATFEHTLPRAEEEESGDQGIEHEEQEANSTEWFVGQVWELLGWDILSGKVARARSHVL